MNSSPCHFRYAPRLRIPYLILGMVLFLGSTVVKASTLFYHSDHLGSGSILSDSSAVILGESQYFPYGSSFQDVSEELSAYKYTGKEADTAISLYYYGARYYDPTIGRFISADPIIPDPINPHIPTIISLPFHILM